MLTPREKSLLPEAERRIEPVTLHHAGQQAQHTTDRAIPVLPYVPFCLSSCPMNRLLDVSRSVTAVMKWHQSHPFCLWLFLTSHCAFQLLVFSTSGLFMCLLSTQWYG